jgi:aminoglycoside phosphotransferase family enzyme/predicted kinase
MVTIAEDDPQERVVRLLADPGTYPPGIGEVTHLQTHISHVFLAGPYAYKLKKGVVFPFLDFGTPASREHFCREELRLNRRLAAPVYLDVLPIVASDAGLRLGGRGAPVDWVVRMRRLPADRTLGALLARKAVDAATVERLAAHLAAFHAAVPPAPGGDPERLLVDWRENLDGVRAMVGELLAAEDYDVLADFGPTYLVRHDAVLRARVQLGHVRDGHGDLRMDHVYVLAESLPPLADAPAVPAGLYVVDCLEFSPALRAVDVAADLSFLAMELEALGHAAHARALVAAYAEAAGDSLVPALIPFHACHRAIVRGKVEGLTAGETGIPAVERAAARERARRQFAVAGRFAWRSGDPVVVACTGLSGTGKSALAAMLAAAAGFEVASSDVLRRQVIPAGEARYTVAARAAVYARLRREVETALGAGQSVVVDATFLSRAERDRLARTVRAYGRRHLFVACEADQAVVRRRLEARDVASVSDARWETHLAQRREQDAFGTDEPVLRLDTTGTLPEVRRTLLPRLWAWRQGRPIPSAA